MARPRLNPDRTSLFLGILLLILGLGVDFGFTRPQGSRAEMLAERLTTLQGRIGLLSMERTSERKLAGIMAEITEGDPADELVDPIQHVNDNLQQAGLRRLELATQFTETTNALESTRFFVRAEGTYPEVLEFVRRMENGTPLTSFQAISIQSMIGSSNLEARMDLTILRSGGPR